jgi:hypothetical protein
MLAAELILSLQPRADLLALGDILVGSETAAVGIGWTV